MSKSICLMTALPPSEGHEALIRWASNFGNDHLYVLVCGRPTDPIDLYRRTSAIQNQFWGNLNITFIPILHNHPDYPEQFDGPVEEFDQIWVKEINKHVQLTSEDWLHASDAYGKRFADNLGVNFAPFDPNREIVKISGTKIRREPFKHFNKIVPMMQKDLRKTITIFGAESCGKTTISRKLSEKYNAPYTPEWARPYLESLETPETTDERMNVIVRGQLAVQKTAQALVGSPFIFQDTDLFSTLGYYDLYKGGTSKENGRCAGLAVDNKSDLYIVMNSNIKFCPDPLRYGGDKRESTDEFWIDILESYGLNYYFVQSTNQHAQEDEVQKIIEKFFLDQNPVFGFERV